MAVSRSTGVMKLREAGGDVTELPPEVKRLILRTRTTGSTQNGFLTSSFKRKAKLTMHEKPAKYLDGVFSQFENEAAIRELMEQTSAIGI